jgi:hypothetical protein
MPKTLTVPRVFAIIMLALILWASGVVLIRLLLPGGALGDGRTALVYGAVLVTTVPTVWFAPHLVGLGAQHRQVVTSLVAGVAAMMDGVCIRYTGIYATDPRDLANSAAALLWAIGVAVVIGLLAGLRQHPN